MQWKYTRSIQQILNKYLRNKKMQWKCPRSIKQVLNKYLGNKSNAMEIYKKYSTNIEKIS